MARLILGEDLGDAAALGDGTRFDVAILGDVELFRLCELLCELPLVALGAVTTISGRSYLLEAALALASAAERLLPGDGLDEGPAEPGRRTPGTDVRVVATGAGLDTAAGCGLGDLGESAFRSFKLKLPLYLEAGGATTVRPEDPAESDRSASLLAFLLAARRA